MCSICVCLYICVFTILWANWIYWLWQYFSCINFVDEILSGHCVNAPHHIRRTHTHTRSFGSPDKCRIIIFAKRSRFCCGWMVKHVNIHDIKIIIGLLGGYEKCVSFGWGFSVVLLGWCAEPPNGIKSFAYGFISGQLHALGSMFIRR